MLDGFYFWEKFFGANCIIDTPPHISLSCTDSSVAPPGVFIFLVWVFVSKNIHKPAFFQKFRKFFSFWKGEANSIFVFFCSRNVELGVSNIEITYEKNVFSPFFLEMFDIFKKLII